MRAALVAAAALLVVACGGRDAGGGPGAAAAGPCGRPASAATLDTADGRTVVDVPDAPAGRRLPVVLVLHGLGDEGGSTRLWTRVPAQGAVVVWPTAPSRRWALPTAEPVDDDLAVLRRAIDGAAALACVDRGRVVVAGISNGARMARIAGCALPGVRAIAPVAGGFRSMPPCRPPRPVAATFVHGTADRPAPYALARREAAAWARRTGCRGGPAAERVRPRTTRLRWRGCRAPVELLRVEGGGHDWPLGGEAPDATQEVLRLVRHRAPAVR